MLYAKVVAIDFDGVIQQHITPWDSKNPHIIPDGPVPGALEFMAELLFNGFEIVIFTLRARETAVKEAVYEWLHHHWGTLPAALLDQIGDDHFIIENSNKIVVTHEKPQACLYIDDHGYHFTGTFPTIEFIQNFKPWNRK